MKLLFQTLLLCLALSVSLSTPFHHGVGEHLDEPAEAAKSEDSAKPEDAAKSEDAGEPVDAAKSEDAGEHEDAAKSEDAGEHEDAAKSEDAGEHEDAAKSEDAGKSEHDHSKYFGDGLNRCKGIEFDAVSVSKDGVPYFFKDNQMWKGFHGGSTLSNETFAEMDDSNNLGHVDAAFRMHAEDCSDEHGNMFFFLDSLVFSYNDSHLQEGYPKKISEAFPGLPNHLDAAVACPKGDCGNDTIIFFKGAEIYHFDVKSKTLEEKEFKDMPNCTAAVRFMDHYYCFHGQTFSKFDPMTGQVHWKNPKETRDYFMRCPAFGDKTANEHLGREQCSFVHLDAITADDNATFYAFRGHHFLTKAGDEFQSHTIDSAFQELHSDVDAVFSYDGHFYMIKGDVVFVYKTGEPHALLEGYPKPLKEELGIDGPVQAAFLCGDDHIVNIIKGQRIYDVDLKASPRAPTHDIPLAYKDVSGAMCGPEGVTLMMGNFYHIFASTKIMIAGKMMPEIKVVPWDMLGCKE